MFDLNVLCIGQQQPTIEIPGNDSIWMEAQNEDPTIKPKSYCGIAPVMNFLDGIWYELYLSAYEYAGTALCGITSFDGSKAPFWVDPEAAKSVTPLIFREENLESFRVIIDFLVSQSPIHSVIVFSRFQSDEQEVILVTFLVDDFFRYLVEGKVLSNVCYVISDKVKHQIEVDPNGIVWVGNIRIQ